LHGDLHHENIICASRDPWLAIDPKGLMGDPPFNAGSMLIHLKPKQKIENPKLIILRKVEILTEMLDYDRETISAWGYATPVLAACFSSDDDISWISWTMEMADSLK